MNQIHKFPSLVTRYNSFSFARTVAYTLRPESPLCRSIHRSKTVIRKDMIYRMLFFVCIHTHTLTNGRVCTYVYKKRMRIKKKNKKMYLHGMGSVFQENGSSQNTQTGANLSSVSPPPSVHGRRRRTTRLTYKTDKRVAKGRGILD